MKGFGSWHCALSVAAVALLLAGCGGSALPIGTQEAVPQSRSAHQVCPQARPGEARCLALAQDLGVKPRCTGSACGWAPIDFQTRYNLPTGNGAGQIVAIVDAYDNPKVSSDLAVYRSNFGLGTAKFFKYNQEGRQKSYPSGSSGWGSEIDLDVEMVSAACPKCTIYLVEANSSTGSDLQTAENEAVKLGAHIVSNSWFCDGSLSCVDQKDFAASGVTYLGAAGNSGSGLEGAPAAFDSVVAVGGTQLAKSGSQYSETVWDSSGGGCVTGVTKPKWQSVIPNSVCADRITNDVAAEAGCSPGVAEYDSYGAGGWSAECGTSVSVSLLAGVFGLAGNASHQIGGRTFWQNKHHKHLYRISGACGYRLHQYTTCAGWGSPDGIGAF
jgi:subtilase family serine protease